jgi:hypothetical protein
MVQNDKIKFDVFVSPQTYTNQIVEANKETDNEIKKQKLERLLQSIDENNVNFSSSIETLNLEIIKLKQFAEKSAANFTNVNAEQAGSSLIIDDYKTVYELSYVRNITMVLGLLGLASFIYNKWN